MKFDIDSFATNTAKEIGGGLLNQIFAGINDRRQIRQQKRLQEIAIKGNKELADFQTQKSLDMWNATNYEAQKEHLKNAGLNPALLYGGGGGGGATTNTGGGMAIGSGANAANAAQTQEAAIQQRLLNAQIENIEANTNKTNQEAGKIPIETENISQQTTNLKETLKNITADTKNKEAQTTAINIENNINKVKERIMTDPLNFNQIQDGILADYNKAYYEAKLMFNQAYIAEKTQQTVINMIRQEYENMGIQKLVMQSNINLNKQQIKMLTQTIQYQMDLIEQGKLDREQGAKNVETIANAMMWGAGIQATGNIINSALNWKKDLMMQDKDIKSRNHDKRLEATFRENEIRVREQEKRATEILQKNYRRKY